MLSRGRLHRPPRGSRHALPAGGEHGRRPATAARVPQRHRCRRHPQGDRHASGRPRPGAADSVRPRPGWRTRAGQASAASAGHGEPGLSRPLLLPAAAALALLDADRRDVAVRRPRLRSDHGALQPGTGTDESDRTLSGKYPRPGSCVTTPPPHDRQVERQPARTGTTQWYVASAAQPPPGSRDYRDGRDVRQKWRIRLHANAGT